MAVDPERTPTKNPDPRKKKGESRMRISQTQKDRLHLICAAREAMEQSGLFPLATERFPPGPDIIRLIG
jgi:hypothetical protein